MQDGDSSPEIEIRDMEVTDIPKVYSLGNRLFTSEDYVTLYRTWDAYEVTTAFNQDPDLCVVAVDERGRLVGFALGTTFEKEQGSWTYGHLVWLGVRPSSQGKRVGLRLYREMERRFREQGARMLLVDTTETNVRAMTFFQRVGFERPRMQVWMSKVLRRPRKRRAVRASPALVPDQRQPPPPPALPVQPRRRRPKSGQPR